MGWGKIERDRLPEGVTRVEYLATDGLSWIDTGIPMSSGGEVITEHMFVVSSAKRQLMGSNTSRQYYGVTTSGYIEFGALNVNASTVLANANTIYTISYKAENGDNICSIYSGGSLLFQKSGAYNSLSGNFIIFNVGGGSQFQFISGNRIYSFKMLFGGVLVRDMIPVRFTNDQGVVEGAMWDKVSKQLFRNAGNGAFLYGSDTLVSKPVISLHKKYVWENPYVTDGLVAMWDGEWNAGGGDHDANGGLVEILSGTETFCRRGAYSIGNNSIICNAVVISSPFITSLNSLNNGCLTIEVCGNATSRACNMGGNRPFVGNMIWSNDGYYMVHSSCTDSALQSSWATGLVQTYRSQRALTISNDTVTWWVNGTFNSSAQKTKQIEVVGNEFPIWGNDYSFTFTESGEFCALRIYSRALTAAEIAANYAVDKQRFNLP